MPLILSSEAFLVVFKLSSSNLPHLPSGYSLNGLWFTSKMYATENRVCGIFLCVLENSISFYNIEIVSDYLIISNLLK